MSHILDGTNFNEIFIPREDKKSTGCCFRIFCPCYYLFCCCCCCEQGFKVTRMRFVARFQKWINVVSPTIEGFSSVDRNKAIQSMITSWNYNLDWYQRYFLVVFSATLISSKCIHPASFFLCKFLNYSCCEFPNWLFCLHHGFKLKSCFLRIIGNAGGKDNYEGFWNLIWLTAYQLRTF